MTLLFVPVCRQFATLNFLATLLRSEQTAEHHCTETFTRTAELASELVAEE